MSHFHSRGWALAVFCCWTTVGGIIGAAVSYFAYARQAREFASTALVRFERFEVGPSNTSSVERHESQQGQVDVAPQLRVSQHNRTDDSLMLSGQAVLSQAVAAGKLLEMPELRAATGMPDQTSADELVRDWVASGRLVVAKVETTSSGGVYSVTISSGLPSVSKRVVTAVVEAMVDRFDGKVSEKRLERRIQTLGVRRVELGRQVEVLQRTIGELTLPEQAVLRKGSVVSPASIKLEVSIRSFERLTLKREDLQQRLRRAEELLAQNADDLRVFETLGLVTRKGEVFDSGLSQTEAKKKQFDLERREWFASKEKVIASVEREVQPLKQQLDELLGVKYGPQHPQIKHLKMLIAKAKGKLAEYSVEPDFEGTNTAGLEDRVEAYVPTAGDNRQRGVERRLVKPEGDSLKLVLSVLTNEFEGLSGDLSSLDDELETLATDVAKEAQLLRSHEKLGREMLQLQKNRESLEGEMQHAIRLHERVPSSCEVLISPGPAVQVFPLLKSYLMFGSVAGGVGGLALFILIWFVINLVPNKTTDQ